ncbi:MAG: zf-HC2 domain-containing protein [Acidobacteria bacterium]|nr:zf-HC2 domain-containing protein [Acidobacteriota bacterium]
MDDCQKVREFTGPYLDNELDAVTTQNIAAHLEQCALCRREMETYRSQDELLARAIKSVAYDTAKLRGSIEAATIGRRWSASPLWAGLVTPRWAIASVCAVAILAITILYLPGRMGTTFARPLYEAAAHDHRMCGTEAAAPDWLRTRSSIGELAASYLDQKVSIPPVIGDYRLDRARVCHFGDASFLHIIYKSRAGGEASLFIGRNQGGLTLGTRTINLDGHTIQLARASNLDVMTTRIGNHLLVATAEESNDATAVLMSALSNIRG